MSAKQATVHIYLPHEMYLCTVSRRSGYYRGYYDDEVKLSRNVASIDLKVKDTHSRVKEATALLLILVRE